MESAQDQEHSTKNAFKIVLERGVKLAELDRKRLKNDVNRCNYDQIEQAWVCPISSKKLVTELLEQRGIRATCVDIISLEVAKSRAIRDINSRLEWLDRDILEADRQLLSDTVKHGDSRPEDFETAPNADEMDFAKFAVEMDFHKRYVALQEKRKERDNLRLSSKRHDKEDQTNTHADTIVVEPSKIHEAVNAAESLIRRKKLGVYQRKGQLVRIVQAGSKDKSGIMERDPHTLIIIDVDTTYMEELLTKEGSWARYDIREKKPRPIDCPAKVAKMLKTRMEWNIDELGGIILCPTLRRDGSILQKTGYDQSSGLYVHYDGPAFSLIEERPTKDDALAAMEILKRLYQGFPFEDDASASVAISAVLTALIRRSISHAPLHAFTAPKMGSGKSLLAEVVSLIVTGRKLTAMPQSETESEERKRLLAVLLEGDPIITYDNIEKPFGSAALCAVLTQAEFKDRVLGLTKSATAPTNTTFLMTGNNLVFVGDISTRVVLCKINPGTERPEEREFNVDLRDYIPKHRGELIHAGLTILKAYHAAGCPKQSIRQFGRFEEWSAWVRSAIVWLGMEDPCTSRMAVEADDPTRNQLIALLGALFDIYDNVAVLTKDIVKRADDLDAKQNMGALKEALLDVASDPKQIGKACHRRLGNYLRKHKGRIEGGLMIEKHGEIQHQTLWRVRRA